MACVRKIAPFTIFYEYHFNKIIENSVLYFFSMAAVDSSNPVMPEPEWAKPRDKNAPPPVQTVTTLIYV